MGRITTREGGGLDDLRGGVDFQAVLEDVGVGWTVIGWNIFWSCLA